MWVRFYSALVLALLSGAAAADSVEMSYPDAVKAAKFGKWEKVRSLMSAAISERPPPMSGTMPNPDVSQPAFSYIPHAYLAKAEMELGRCAEARAALAAPGHVQAVAAATPKWKQVAADYQSEVSSRCPAPAAVDPGLLQRGRELLERLRRAISDLDRVVAGVPGESRGESTTIRAEIVRAENALSGTLTGQDSAAIDSAIDAGEGLLARATVEVARLDDIANAQLVAAAAADAETAAVDPPPVAPPMPPAALSPALGSRVSGLLAGSATEMRRASGMARNPALSALPQQGTLTEVMRRVESTTQQLRVAAEQADEAAAERLASNLEGILGELRTASAGAEQLLATSAGPPGELLTAIKMFLAGKYQQVISTRVDPLPSPKARAHLLMLQSASLLHQSNADRSQQLRGRAEEFARQAKREDRSVVPSNRVFSRAFIALFQQA